MMKKWQKYWLYFSIFLFALHLLRDILQAFAIKVLLATILVKKPSYPIISSIVWILFNTYLIALIEIVLGIYCLKKQQFGKIGWLTIFIAVTTLIVWLIYWFFL